MKGRMFMRYLTFLLSLFCVLLPAKILKANNAKSVVDVNQQLTIIFQHANTHNLQALEGMKATIERMDNSTLTLAYALGCYMAAPEKYERQYVAIFPSDTNGIMNGLYEGIELKRLTPKFLYSIEALGQVALKGNSYALEKVLTGVIHSDGAVSELFCDYTVKLFDKNLQKTLTKLSRMEPSGRSGIYQCFKLMSPEDVELLKSKVKKKKTNDKGVKTVIQEIGHYSP